MEVRYGQAEPWEVATLIDTGNTTLTSGRQKRMQPFMANHRWE